MRKWHRWLSVLFGVFLLWIAGTGLAIQYNHVSGQDERKPPTAAELARRHPGFVCPEDMTCRPKMDKGEVNWPMLIKHLHAGEPFGPIGTALSILSGVALAFFSVSGLWMYLSMWRNRKVRNVKPCWFWE